MSLREFARRVNATREANRRAQEERLWLTALNVAYTYNTIGGVVAGSKWKVRHPKDFYDEWTGETEAEAWDVRIERFENADKTLKERDSWL